MATSDSTTQRNASLQSFVTTLGANAYARLYTGSRPGGGPAASATGTLLATITFGSTNILDANGGSAGSVTGGVLTTGGYTQTAASHVNGTPGYIRWFTSGGTAVRDTDVSSSAVAGNVQFNGTVATGVAITGAITYTDGNP
jgi:hypothetical protein